MSFPSDERKKEEACTVSRPEKVGNHSRQRRITFKGVLIVGLLVISSHLLFQYFTTVIANDFFKFIAAPQGTSVVARTETNGLETTLSITPGPYFLSELLAVDITFTNHSQPNLILGGALLLDRCGGAFGVTITGGTEPHYVSPIDTLRMHCPAPFPRQLDMGKSLSVHGYVPITRSGSAIVTTKIWITSSSQNQGERWPTIPIAVAAQIPSDRQILLKAQGNDVAIVNASDALRSQMVYLFTVSCPHGYGTNVSWEPLKTTVLHEPYCDDPGRRWTYSVGAPGYAVASLTLSV